MTDEFCFPSPSVLRFTPEVLSGELAAQTLAFTSFATAEPSEMDLEILARELLLYSPELASQLIALGKIKMEAA